jgi:hypothetical protein
MYFFEQKAAQHNNTIMPVWDADQGHNEEEFNEDTKFRKESDLNEKSKSRGVGVERRI